MKMPDLEAIKNSGVPLMATGGGQMAALRGMKARFSFTCLACQAKYETAGEYAMSDNLAKSALKQSASSGISSILYSLLGRIPVIGYFLSGMASSAVYSTVSAASGNPAEQARDKAFEEVKGKFQACSKCGQYGCASCLKDGICPSCRQS
jgi:hypothetical protein